MEPRAERVEDVMTTGVVTVGRTDTLGEFLELIDRENISGAPVVAENGRVVGVISLRDVLRALRPRAERKLSVPPSNPGAAPPARGGEGRPSFYLADPDAVAGRGGVGDRPGALSDRKAGAFIVGDVMTPAVFSLRLEATLAEAARFLAEAEIHRALVFRDERLVGLVTTFDILRALAGSTDR